MMKITDLSILCKWKNVKNRLCIKYKYAYTVGQIYIYIYIFIIINLSSRVLISTLQKKTEILTRDFLLSALSNEFLKIGKILSYLTNMVISHIHDRLIQSI